MRCNFDIAWKAGYNRFPILSCRPIPGWAGFWKADYPVLYKGETSRIRSTISGRMLKT